MLEGKGCKQRAVFFHIFQDDRIGILYEQAFKGTCQAVQMTCGVNILIEGYIIFSTYTIVILTIRISGVNDTGTVCQCNIIIAGYEVALEIIAVGLEIKQRLIFYIFQICALHGFCDFVIIFAQNAVQEGLSHDYIIILIFCLNIGFICIDGKDDVGGQCPRGCCPCQEVGVFRICTFEFCDSGGFLYILIALCNLVRGKGCAAARAIGNNLVALIQQALIPNLLQCPPFGFDIVIMVCDIGMIHIRPEADTVTHGAPFLLVCPYAFLTFFDKRLYAVAFDLILAIQTKCFFNLQLNRQTVGIPAGLSQHLVALHGFVAGD